MIILITGASHTGKTLLAQKMLEKYHYPYPTKVLGSAADRYHSPGPEQEEISASAKTDGGYAKEG